jgi:hypothetical protein
VAQHPLTANARSITNWDFTSATVPVGQVAAPVLNSRTVALTQVKGRFPVSSPFYVTLNTAQSVQHAVVQGYAPGTRGTGTLSLALPATLPVGARVEMAGALGTVPYIDYDNNGVKDTLAERVDFRLSHSASPGGVRANGGLLWFGDVRASNLRDHGTADAVSAAAGIIRASGVMQIVAGPPAPEPASTPQVLLSGQYSDNQRTQTVRDATLASSSADSAFPGNGTGWGNMTAAQKAQLVDDGWNRLAGNDTAERQVRHFVPPDITGGSSGVSLYRQKSKYSKAPDYSASASAALHGYGEGIYINNPQDRERVGTGVNTYREMTPLELRNMWFSSVAGSASTGTEYYRLSQPSRASATNKSLEQQHLRGWVGPDEFRARGALVEINDNNTVTITLDSRDDSPAYNTGTAAHKAWRTPEGTLLGHATAGGVYVKTFAWPANGVIFAEGNLRVRGTATHPPRSLTIVSTNATVISL